MISRGANTAESSTADRQKASVAMRSAMPRMISPPPIRLTDNFDARSSPIVTVAILSRDRALCASPRTGHKLLSGSKKIRNMSAHRHDFDEEAIMAFDALYLFVRIARIVVRQVRLNQFLLVCGIQDV